MLQSPIVIIVKKDGEKISLHPVTDYQFGSVRDDFDFGSVVLLNAADVLAASEEFDKGRQRSS